MNLPIEKIMTMGNIPPWGYYVLFVIFLVPLLILSIRKVDDFYRDIFRERRFKNVKNAIETIKNPSPEDNEFYEEILKQELFFITTGINASKNERAIYHKLVNDGIASAKEIRLSQAHIVAGNDLSLIEISKFEKFSKYVSLLFFIALFSLGLMGLIVFSLGIIGGSGFSYIQNLIAPLSLIAFSFVVLNGAIPVRVAERIEKRLERGDGA